MVTFQPSCIQKKDVIQVNQIKSFKQDQVISVSSEATTTKLPELSLL